MCLNVVIFHWLSGNVRVGFRHGRPHCTDYDLLGLYPDGFVKGMLAFSSFSIVHFIQNIKQIR